MHSRSKNVLFSHLVCKITLDIKKNAEVSFELWTETPDQEQGWDLWAIILFTRLNTAVTCGNDSGYIVFYLFRVLQREKVEQGVTVSEKFK